MQWKQGLGQGLPTEGGSIEGDGLKGAATMQETDISRDAAQS